jgi:hypothetical protein
VWKIVDNSFVEWTMYHRSILFVSVLTLLGGIWAAISLIRAELYGRWRPSLARFIALCALGSVIFAVAALAFLYGLLPAFEFLIRTFGLHQAQAIVGVLVISAGFAAHRLKRNHQQLYGFVEVCFGATSAISIAAGMSPGQALFSRWTALAGCTYVVARGLNNMSDASKQTARINQSAASNDDSKSATENGRQTQHEKILDRTNPTPLRPPLPNTQ